MVRYFCLMQMFIFLLKTRQTFALGLTTWYCCCSSVSVFLCNVLPLSMVRLWCSLFHSHLCLWFSSADTPLCTWHRNICCGDPAWVYYLLANGKFLNEYVSTPRIRPVSRMEERSTCLSNWLFWFIPHTNGGLTQHFEWGTEEWGFSCGLCQKHLDMIWVDLWARQEEPHCSKTHKHQPAPENTTTVI